MKLNHPTCFPHFWDSEHCLTQIQVLLVVLLAVLLVVLLSFLAVHPQFSPWLLGLS